MTKLWHVTKFSKGDHDKARRFSTTAAGLYLELQLAAQKDEFILKREA